MRAMVCNGFDGPADSALKPMIQAVLPLCDAPQAMQRLLDRKVNGRIVLLVTAK